MQRIRCILVGDSGVGKTTLLKDDKNSSYDFKLYQDGPRFYKTFAADIYSTIVEIGENSINFEIWDTSEFDEIKTCKHLDSTSYPYAVSLSFLAYYT